MLLCCSLEYDNELTPAECARNLREAGFTHTFLTWGFHGEGLRSVEAARNAGLTVETIHASYNGVNEIWFDNEIGDARMKYFLDCVRGTAEVGVRTMILHVSSGLKPPAFNEYGLERYRRICNEGERLGVQIAFENLRYIAYLRYIMENVDSPAKKFCFDCGHENLYDGGNGVLEEFAPLLCAVHLHDNPGDHDVHQVPFTGTVDWDRLAGRLAAIGFSLPVTLELKGSGGGLPYAKEAYAAAVKFAGMIAKNAEIGQNLPE